MICEGAGSPAEINLRAGDFVNMGLARAAGLPAIVVGDIDRGGVFAALFGTVALLDAGRPGAGRRLRHQQVPGRRSACWRPGLDMLTRADRAADATACCRSTSTCGWTRRTRWPTGGCSAGRRRPRGTEWLRVAVVRLPRISNATDAEALAAEPGVRVRLTDRAGRARRRRPGRAARLQVHRGRPGLAARDRPGRRGAARTPRAGRPVLGICGGFQMLAERIHDEVESRRGTVAGLGLLPVEITFGPEKTLAPAVGAAPAGIRCSGYEIHHGFVSAARRRRRRCCTYADGRPEGAAAGQRLRHALARRLRVRRVPPAVPDRGGARWPGGTASWSRRTPGSPRSAKRTVDLLGDLVEEHLDTDALWRLITEGPPAGLPFIPPAPTASAPVSRQSPRLPSRRCRRDRVGSRGVGIERYADLAERIMRRPPRLGGGPAGGGRRAGRRRQDHVRRAAGHGAARARASPSSSCTPTTCSTAGPTSFTFWPRLRGVGARAAAAAASPAATGATLARAGASRTPGARSAVREVLLVEGVASARSEAAPYAEPCRVRAAPARPAAGPRPGARRRGACASGRGCAWMAAEDEHFAADATAGRPTWWSTARAERCVARRTRPSSSDLPSTRRAAGRRSGR